MKSTSFPQRQQGFGLVEVLAAMLVLAVGVVGFAALQMRAVQTSGDAYYRTQAISIAQDLAERTHANPSQVAYYINALNWPATKQESPPEDCIASACTPAALAAGDVLSVRFAAQTLLPEGRIAMGTCMGSVLNCIYVSWDGVEPTAGTTGQCVNENGVYRAPPGNRPMLPCVMLEVQ
jgi:type IV pilus assembly protein PilV